MHHEMELLIAAGLTNQQALAAATSRAAACFKLGDLGRVATGLRADLLLVRGNPLVDIKATRNIVSVWKGGYPIDRAKRLQKLNEIRSKEAAKAANKAEGEAGTGEKAK